MTSLDVLRAAVEKLTAGPLDDGCLRSAFGGIGIVKRGDLSVSWDVTGSTRVDIGGDRICVPPSAEREALMRTLDDYIMEGMTEERMAVMLRMMERIRGA